MKYTRRQILENRRKWVNQLLKVDSLGYTDGLECLSGDGSRDCFGHAYHALGYEKYVQDDIVIYDDHSDYASKSLIEKLGLFNEHGAFGDFAESANSLMHLNDYEKLSPQQIGRYLLENIEGGENTPFISLNTYSE